MPRLRTAATPRIAAAPARSSSVETPPLNAGLAGLIRHASQDRRGADRAHRVEERPAHGQEERARMHPDVGADQPQPPREDPRSADAVCVARSPLPFRPASYAGAGRRRGVEPWHRPCDDARMTELRPWHASYPPDVPSLARALSRRIRLRPVARGRRGLPEAHRPSRSSGGTSPTGGCCARSSDARRCWRASGIGKGDRVGLLLPNCPEYVISWYACQRLGAMAVGNNPLYTERELEHQIKDSGARVMVVLDQIYSRFGARARGRRHGRGHRREAEPLHALADQVAGAAEVQVRREGARHAAAVRPCRTTRCAGGRT